ncbi:MAG: DUF6273 domain-containing protein [Clostridium sp.]|nr:DUF6273 domain-containing protein [Clostridium sp.]
MRITKNRKPADKGKRLAAVLLSGTLAVTSCLAVPQVAEAAETSNSGLQNPRVEMNTCDTVYFGSYWQEDTNGDGVADQKDEKQPIRWRILWQNEDGTDAYVLADKVLDCQPYNTENTEVTWETCSLRKWLNADFLDNAFTEAEQAVILPQTLENADVVNRYYDDEGEHAHQTPGGNDTVDKIYLPSVADMGDATYGFSENSNWDDQARIGKATAYAREQGIDIDGGESSWWTLRSPGDDTSHASYVYLDGSVNTLGDDIYYDGGVRPALHINLSSPLVQKGEKLDTSLKRAEWDLVELGTYNEKSIRWRVLHTEGDDAYLLSDRVLAYRKYHEESDIPVTWKDSTLRSWLNSEFYEQAFTEAEKNGIRQYTYKDSDNPWYGTEGGEATEDYVTILSLKDVVNLEYGFPTDYCFKHSAWKAYGQDGVRNWWWLRSPGINEFYVSSVHSDGYMDPDGGYVDKPMGGVRPALYVNLSTLPLQKVGTVSSDEMGNAGDNPDTLEEPTEKPDITPEQPTPPETPVTTPEKPAVTPGTSAETPSATTEAPAGQTAGQEDTSTTANIKNKKTYKTSKKVTIKDSDGIKQIKINSKTIKVKGKKSFTFKLSQYKKYLKKKGKWNKLVITDKTGKKTTIKFKTK